MYPKLSLIDNDTIVLVTPDQIKKANLLFNERDMYREQSDSLSNTIAAYQYQIDGRDTLIEDLRYNIDTLSDSYIKTLEENWELKQDNKFWKVASGVLGVIAVILLIL